MNERAVSTDGARSFIQKYTLNDNRFDSPEIVFITEKYENTA